MNNPKCASKFRTVVAVAATLGLGPTFAVAESHHHSTRFLQTNLVSDVPGLAAVTDSHLVNAWGLSRSATTPWWVADNGTGLSTLYNGVGTPVALVVTVPNVPGTTDAAAPTGTVFNGTNDFQVGPNQPARFLFVTEEGTLSGWNPGANATMAILKVNNAGKAVYKGLAIGQINGANVLYAANFFSGTVDVFDANFAPVSLAWGAFRDWKLPKQYAPFNVQAIGDTIYVAYARQDDTMFDEVAGPGRGFVDAFTMDGMLKMRIHHGAYLNAPWGLALAPADFGTFSNMLLVGQFGSGKIAAFDPATGRFRGLLRGDHCRPIRIEGLWALSFGGGNANSGPANSLYFSAGIDDEAHGLFGTLTALPPSPHNHDNDKGKHDDGGDDRED